MVKISTAVGLILATLVQVGQCLDVNSLDDTKAVAKSALGPLQQYFTGANIVSGKGQWIEQSSSGKWVVQWHESGQYFDLFYQYALFTGDGSSSGFATSNVQAASNGNDFLGIYKASDDQDERWNDDIAWWAISSLTGAESGAGGNLRNLASTTFDQIWQSWDDKCGGGIYWSRSRKPNSANPYLKSTITNVQMMDLGARLGQGDKANQIWNWLKSANLVVDDGDGGYVIYDRVLTNDCGTVAREVYSYEYGEAIAALAVMGRLDEATKVFNGLKSIFVDGNNVLGQCMGSCAPKKNPSGYNWSVYKGLAYLYKYTSDPNVRASIATIIRASAQAVVVNRQNGFMSVNPGGQFTLVEPEGLNIRDQFEVVGVLNALIVVNGGWGAPAAPAAGSSQIIINGSGNGGLVINAGGGGSGSNIIVTNIVAPAVTVVEATTTTTTTTTTTNAVVAVATTTNAVAVTENSGPASPIAVVKTSTSPAAIPTYIVVNAAAATSSAAGPAAATTVVAPSPSTAVLAQATTSRSATTYSSYIPPAVTTVAASSKYTTPAYTTPSIPNSSGSSGTSSISTGAVVGGAAGGIFIVAALAAGAFVLYKKKTAAATAAAAAAAPLAPNSAFMTAV
ncbi:glycosyl hydrolase family 76-domain-containing protein [Obelidium mucronatum]|nr:glycosyl hydrolase family 76-domain-containing protein [Obelidium mucronatum]